MTKQDMFSNRDIADYYDQTEVHYRRFWKLNEEFSIHYGIWEKGVRNLGQALRHTSEVLAVHAGIKPSDFVLDAGCGVGGPAIYLASEYRCHVLGITLSSKQAQAAGEYASRKNLGHLTKFEVADYKRTGYEPDRFDVIWALESTGTATDKQAFLNEAYRILKPGGRLVLADYFKTTDLPSEKQPLLKSWLSLWAIHDLETLNRFETLLVISGFTDVAVHDYTNEIIPTARRMWLYSLFGAIGSVGYNMFHNTTRFAKHHYRSGFLQYKTLKKGLWEYKVILAKKPVISTK
ncbi:MAG: methyltransferase domain-containing protein [Bacteroidales bacterium]|nr:MAG: methyltransferase domain-containing protein [Bacteroidales bacterium]